jgi:glycosyltransferase involved in cell wall biosynthesis
MGLEHGAAMYDVLRDHADRVISISTYNRRHLLEFGFTASQLVDLPVVATDVGAVADVVVDGESGLLVPPGDAEAIATKLDNLLAEPSAWESMGRRGRAHIEAHYDIDAQNDRLVEIYRELLREGRRRR